MSEGRVEIAIAGYGGVSAAGAGRGVFAAHRHGFSRRAFAQGEAWVGAVDDAAASDVVAAYPHVDRAVALGIVAARGAMAEAGWGGEEGGENGGIDAGVCMASSRGATGQWEAGYEAYQAKTRVPARTSPLTTLGNLSSWVAQDLGTRGVDCEVSVTCSGALHAIITAVAWMRGGMAKRFLAGGAEAPLTGFTLAQMQAVRVVSKEDGAWPCRPCAAEGATDGNTMVLGEGAAVVALEVAGEGDRRARIGGVGFGREMVASATGISADGEALAASMRMALAEFGGPVDAVVLHAPGTAAGDAAEIAAVERVFRQRGAGGERLPALVSNKWMIGHTLGASGGLSLGLALELVGGGAFGGWPYDARVENRRVEGARAVMVNATGFGGNAASVIVARGAEPPSKGRIARGPEE